VGSVIFVPHGQRRGVPHLGAGMSSIHRIRYDLHGERGLISTAEPDPWSTVRIHHEPWLAAPGQEADRVYSPDWPGQAELAEKAGHGGGDFWTSYDFANAIRQGQPPYLDVYRATAMSAVSILGWRSCLEEGDPCNPNFQDLAVRQAFVRITVALRRMLAPSQRRLACGYVPSPRPVARQKWSGARP
jgi:hypothetical protein